MKLSQLHKNTIINASKSVIMSLCTHILIDINYILGPRFSNKVTTMNMSRSIPNMVTVILYDKPD